MPTDELAMRRQRLKELMDRGIDPYPSNVLRTHSIKAVQEKFEELQKSKDRLTICGRVMAIRKHGGSTFLTVRDDGHDLQVYLKKDVIGQDGYNIIKEFDSGDFVEVTGALFLTHKGERSILSQTAPRIIAKTLRPLPEKWHGLSDVETRYRKRYLDLLMNNNVRTVNECRSEILRLTREYLYGQDFIEVETPVLQPIPGGATARPFVTHLNVLDLDLYLRVAPELYLKRLLVGGFTKIFEAAKCFRNEGMDHAHNPEFTQIELYQAYTNYRGLMSLVEDLLGFLVTKIFDSYEFKFEQKVIDFTPPIMVKDWTSLLEECLGESIAGMTDKSLRALFLKKGIELGNTRGRGAMLDQAYKKFVRPTIVQPTFLINHPVSLSPLAKRRAENPEQTERFQLVVGSGIELVNGFSELNDPIDQRARFEEQERWREAGDDEAQRLDDDFLEALEYGMPPAAGLGIGIDRLAALLTNSHSLKEVIFFPTMRPKQ